MVIFEIAVIRAVGGKLASLVDDPANGRLADEVSGASGRVSVWDVILYETTEIDL